MKIINEYNPQWIPYQKKLFTLVRGKDLKDST
jgi:hypothetical protein